MIIIDFNSVTMQRIQGFFSRFGTVTKQQATGALSDVSSSAAVDHAKTLPEEQRFHFLVSLLFLARVAGKVSPFWVPSVFAQLKELPAFYRAEANRLLNISTNNQWVDWWIANNQDVEDWDKSVDWSKVSTASLKGLAQSWFPISGNKVSSENFVSVGAILAIFPAMQKGKIWLKFYKQRCVPYLLANMNQDVLDFFTSDICELLEIKDSQMPSIREAVVHKGLRYQGTCNIFAQKLAGVQGPMSEFSPAQMEQFLQVALPIPRYDGCPLVTKPACVDSVIRRLPADQFWRMVVCIITPETEAALNARLQDEQARTSLVDYFNSHVTNHFLPYVRHCLPPPTNHKTSLVWVTAEIQAATNGKVIPCPNSPHLKRFLLFNTRCDLSGLMEVMKERNIVHVIFQMDGEQFPLYFDMCNSRMFKKFQLDSLRGIHKVLARFYNDDNIFSDFVQGAFAAHGMAITPALTNWLLYKSKSPIAKTVATYALTLSDEMKNALIGNTELARFWVEEAHEHYGEQLGKRKKTPNQFEEPSFKCNVCMNTFYHRVNKAARITSCGHILCHDCIQSWQSRGGNTCPSCRTVCGVHTNPAPVPQKSAVGSLMNLLQ